MCAEASVVERRNMHERWPDTTADHTRRGHTGRPGMYASAQMVMPVCVSVVTTRLMQDRSMPRSVDVLVGSGPPRGV